MAIDDYKFIETDFENQGITELPDRPSEGGITASQLKARFDNIPKIIMALGKINNFFDFLKSGEASSDIGATAVKTGGSETVQGVLEELQAQATSIESNAVHKSGNETIDDVKTFTSSPVVPTPTANTHPATKKYVDDKDAAVVHKTGNETVNGVKNFTDSIYVSSFTIRDNGNTGEIIGGTAEDKLAFLQGDLKFNDDLVWTAGNDGPGSTLDADTLDGKQDADMVHKAGAETITGVKTFSASPVVPTPTADVNPATKKYADDIASARYTKTNMQTSGQALLHWGNLTNVPNLADNHWKTPVANQAALPVTGNALGDNRVVLDDGDGKQAVYTCVATTGTYTQQWSKVGDVDWMTEEATRQTQETARVNAEGTESPKSGRVGAEIDRVAAENARILAEGTADPKTGRIGAELDRVDAENARKSAEILRQAHINDKDNPHEVTAAKAGALSTTDAGNLAELTTTEKGSLVGAINEVDMSLNETQQLVSNMIYDGITPNREIWHSVRTPLLVGEQPLTYLDGNTANPNSSYLGHTSARLISTNGLTSRVRLTQNMDLSQYSHIEIVSHFSDLSKISYARINFFVQSTATGAYAVAGPHYIKNRVGGKSGYSRFIVDLKASSYFGGFTDASWENINLIELNLKSQESVSATWDVFAVYGIVSKPALSIDFDDGYISVYDNAYPIMRRLGLYGNANVNTGSLDNSEGTRMTWAQLRELHENGWSINNHTHTHINLSTSLEADIRADLALSRGILKREGFHDGANFLVCPGGNFDAGKWDIYFDYCKYIRTTTPEGLSLNALPRKYLEDARGNMESTYTGISSQDVATVKGYIDDLISKKSFTTLCFHRILDEGVYDKDDFAEIMAYIAAKRDAGELLVLTARDLMYQSKGNVAVDYNGKAYLNSCNAGLPYSINLEVTEL